MLSIFDLWRASFMQYIYSSTDTPTRIVVAALLNAMQGKPEVLELGAHVGGASVLLRDVLMIKGGSLTVVELDATRIPHLRRNLSTDISYVPIHVAQQDALDFVRAQVADTFDFVYVDDDHSEPHVTALIPELQRVCKHGALVCFHDVEPPSEYIGALCVAQGGIVLPIGERGLGLWVIKKT